MSMFPDSGFSLIDASEAIRDAHHSRPRRFERGEPRPVRDYPLTVVRCPRHLQGRPKQPMATAQRGAGLGFGLG